MDTRNNTWAVVLAAGDGTRLASLSVDEHGHAVPKQFCSLNGGKSLLQSSLERARRIASHRQICVVVAQKHERHWRPALFSIRSRNVIVQPRNCGTANGLLLGVLRIIERDPRARIIFLPADHHVSDEMSLTASVRAAAALLDGGCNDLLLIGIEPDGVDPDLGYIIPGGPVSHGIRHVAQFVEKPTEAVARDLIARGAVWNSFIIAAHGASVVARMRECYPEIVEGMAAALAHDAGGRHVARALDRFYENLPTVDFSRAVAQGGESALRVFTAPACGWSDLGTPRRVWNVLQRLWRTQRRAAHPRTRRKPALVNLAAQCRRMGIGDSAMAPVADLAPRDPLNRGELTQRYEGK